MLAVQFCILQVSRNWVRAWEQGYKHGCPDFLVMLGVGMYGDPGLSSVENVVHGFMYMYIFA